MTNTEKTFADRLGRGRLMLAAVELFVPPFAPTDEDISGGSEEALTVKGIPV